MTQLIGLDEVHDKVLDEVLPVRTFPNHSELGWEPCGAMGKRSLRILPVSRGRLEPSLGRPARSPLADGTHAQNIKFFALTSPTSDLFR